VIKRKKEFIEEKVDVYADSRPKEFYGSGAQTFVSPSKQSSDTLRSNVV
jgi:hypothetical protein